MQQHKLEYIVLYVQNDLYFMQQHKLDYIVLFVQNDHLKKYLDAIWLKYTPQRIKLHI